MDQPVYPPLWNESVYGDSVAATGADKLHALGIAGKGLTTAIIDSGFDTGHEVFSGVNIVNGYDGGAEYHGTAVAGIAVGMTPEAGLWLQQISGVPDDSYVAALFEELAADAARYNIVSLNASWGDTIEGDYGSPGDVAYTHPFTAEMVRELLAKGVAIAAATGNSAVNDRMSFPDGLPGVLSVGALNQLGYISAQSTQYRKDGLFLLAPGVNVSTSIMGGGYGPVLGTSIAAPHVSGAVTLLKSGARAAGAEEIISALYDSAMVVPYDGEAEIYYWDMQEGLGIFPLATVDTLEVLASGSVNLDEYIDWVLDFNNDLAGDSAATADRWRIYAHIMTAAALATSDDPYPSLGTPYDGKRGAELFAAIMDNTDVFGEFEHSGYGFMQVDAAYRLLTSRRAEQMADAAALAGSAHAGAMAGFAGALGAGLHQGLVDLFQRLDGQPGEVLARAARQLGPGWVSSTLQSSIFGQLGIHSAAEGRLRRFRGRAAVCADGAQEYAAPGGLMSLSLPDGFVPWYEGFGGWQERQETRDGSGYQGSFAGVMVGMEKTCGERLLGGFAAWANHAIRGDDGRSMGNWGTFGVYGGLSRDRLSAGFSASAGVGGYDLARGVDGPAASLIGMNYDALRVQAEEDSIALSLSMRGTAEWMLFERDGWRLDSGVEGAFAHSFMGGYDEESGSGLSVRGHGESYIEGGAGVRASKTFFRRGAPFLTASVKAAGLYGAGFGRRMSARFVAGGASFSVRPERVRGGWFAPEASLSWRAGERVTLSAAYRGRFGKRLSAHTGSLSVGLEW